MTSKSVTGEIRIASRDSARVSRARARRPIRRASLARIQIQTWVSSSSTSAAIDLVILVERIERALVLEHGACHRSEEAGTASLDHRNQFRDRDAVLGDDVLRAGLPDPVHQLEAARLELGGGHFSRLPRLLRHDHNIMTTAG